MTNDYTTSSNPRFMFRAEMHCPFPDWVVEQPMPGAADFAKKASTAFADQRRRLLPICTKSATFHSAINIFANPEDFDEVTLERVKSACAHYGIEQEVLPYAELFVTEFSKSASLHELQEGRYAIDDTIDGQHFRLLPLNDADDVIGSAFDLAKMAADNRIHLLMLVPAAREIVKAAEQHNVQDKLPALIERYGVERFADPEVAAKKIVGREDLCKDATLRDHLRADYLEAVAGVENDPEDAMRKIAAIDHAAGINANYRVSSLVPTPFDIVFGGALVSDAEKAARENVMIREVLIPLCELQKVASQEADFKLSKSAAEVFSKLRDTVDARDLSIAIETWSEADQRTILRLAVAAA